MEIKILEEHGYVNAIRGFGYSFMDSAVNPDEFYTEEKFDRIEKAALVHVGRGKGMDKFLRQVCLWTDIRAPRYWWSEFDTYKVGTVAQSTSTMHTLSKRDMTIDDLETTPNTIDHQRYLVGYLNEAMDLTESLQELKVYLPESYLQRRLVTMNYGVLHTIIGQRKNHRLPEWRQFIEAIYDQVEHRELLPEYPCGV